MFFSRVRAWWGVFPGVGTAMAEQRVKLFVGGVSGSITEELLSDYFSKYGAVVDTYIRRDSGRTSRGGFGFVTFDDAAALERALHDHQQHFIQGQRVSPRCFSFFALLFPFPPLFFSLCLFLKNFYFPGLWCLLFCLFSFMFPPEKSEFLCGFCSRN